MAQAILIEQHGSVAAVRDRIMDLRREFGISAFQQKLAEGYGLYGTQEQCDRIHAANQKARPTPVLKATPKLVAQPSIPTTTTKKPAAELVSTAPPHGAPTKPPGERTRFPIQKDPEAPRTAAGVWSMSSGDASRMAEELRYAYRRLSTNDAEKWVGRISDRLAAVLLRRMQNLAKTLLGVVGGIGGEIVDLVSAVIYGSPIDHTKKRLQAAADSVSRFARSVGQATKPLFASLKEDPAKVAPDLLIVALSFYVSGGGFDGDGGIPDTDIPLLGIGAHRSPVTHSVIAGAVVETALFSLIDLICIAHDKLPAKHDPRWDLIHDRAWAAANSASKGVSLGLAYHLGVDGLVQPGAYHGLPFEMSMEGHQAVLVTNAVAEGMDAGKKEGEPSAASRQRENPKSASRPSVGKEESTARKVGNLAVGGLVAVLGFIGFG